MKENVKVSVAPKKERKVSIAPVAPVVKELKSLDVLKSLKYSVEQLEYLKSKMTEKNKVYSIEEIKAIVETFKPVLTFVVLEEKTGKKVDLYNCSIPVLKRISKTIVNKELTGLLLEACGADWDRVDRVEDRKGHDLRYSVDITKISNELGYTPQVDFKAGLAATVDWYRNNRAWWEPLKNAPSA